jgi:hypothetical protein
MMRAMARAAFWLSVGVLSVVTATMVVAVGMTGRHGHRSFSLSPDSAAEEAEEEEEAAAEAEAEATGLPVMTTPPGSAEVEQHAMGTRPAATLVESFDGLGVGFQGPQGTATLRNPSDNTLAVGPHHVVQIVNSRMAVYTKQGKVLYGPVATNNVFKGFGGTCEAKNNGDAVVRYDQLADRWLIVMPIFSRAQTRPDQPPVWSSRDGVVLSPPGQPGQPGRAAMLVQPPPPPPDAAGTTAQPQPRPQPRDPSAQGPYSMCYAISTSPDPLGSYYRYEFLRPLFPDYPRPAIWPDGYYVPTSTGDEVIQKHACVVDRAKMLKGEPATEQCVIIDNVNFLNNADVDGKALPPSGAPNIMIAAGGMQLKKVFEDDVLLAWQFHVDWKNPSKTTVTGPEKIAVAPYHYLCDGQLTNCVPQPGIERRLDAQGDKIMQRLVYRKIDSGGGSGRGRTREPRESIVAVHSVNSSAGGGGVRWYEFQIDGDKGKSDKGDKARRLTLRQQGTYAPDGLYRWMASPAIDRFGNIAIGYSFGGGEHFAGQRFAARLADDPPGQMTLAETVLVEGQGVQNVMRWQDYAQAAVDPSDDCTIWYVGDYIKKDATSYSSRIGAFRLPGCH